MEETKKSKGLIWLIIILIIVILGLIGFIVYDKVLTTNNNLVDPTKSSTTKQTTIQTTNNNEEPHSIIELFNSLPQENDNSVLWEGDIYNLISKYIDFNTNFKNVEKTENGFNLSYSCVSYNENNNDESVDKCTKFKIDIAGKDNDIFADVNYGLKIIFTKSYIITYENGYVGNLRIFDKGGQEIFKEYISTDFIIDEDSYNNGIDGYSPAIKDNKLYFVKYENNNNQTFIASSYDLNTHEIKKIMHFEAEIGIY